MRVLVTGGQGMLGRTISDVMTDVEVIPADKDEADIMDENGFEDALQRWVPDAVIHCAAMTAVDTCEHYVDRAYGLNAVGSANVASACDRNGVRLIAVSTDYVFSGMANRPYTEYDRANGGSTVYGRSKLAGEEQVRALCPDHCICRTGWLYGKGGPSFVHTMLRLADGTRPFLKVVDDQVGNPTSAYALARELRALLDRPLLRGTFHMTCEGATSWAGFAKEIFRIAGIDQVVRPCSAAEFPRPARRPANSRLDKMAIRLTGLPPMPDWRDALAEFMEIEFNIKEEDR